MKSLVEAVAYIVLFILTPVIMVWVQISLAQVIEKLGELPIEESKARPGQFTVGLGILRRLCSTLSRSSIAQTVAERSHSRLTLF
jgi:hypothetical protein